jgi:hypothetical protein
MRLCGQSELKLTRLNFACLSSAHKICAILISLFVLFPFLSTPMASASPVAVRYKEGLVHGFLVLSTMDGVVIAHGELSQVAHGDQVTSDLIFHFKDGSLQEETTVYTEHRVFRLIGYHLVQKGPAFKHPIEVSIVTSSGEVAIHSTDDKGKEKDSSGHLELPADLANGMVPTLLTNLPSGAQVELPMLVTTPKARIVKLEITPNGKDAITFGSATHEAVRYVIKVNLGGVAGVVAPVVGKQPPDDQVWILEGEAPVFVKSEMLSYEGGPMWRVELAAPEWPHDPAHESPHDKQH